VKLSGEVRLCGRPQEVFDRLLDPEVIKRCIDGCERFELVAPKRYEFTATARLGAFRGTFEGVAEVSDIVAPENYTISVSGKSKLGRVEGSASVRLLEAQGQLRLHYEVEARVSGMIAAVGGSMIDLWAKKAVSEVFARLAREIATPAIRPDE
jgi:carbon monoxide dehydrogenase subunit G